MNESRLPTSPTALGLIVTGPPVPWQRASRGNGKTFTAPETRTYQGKIRLIGFAMRPPFWDLGGSYRVEIDVTFADARRRDIDNVCKTVLDALNGVAWNDDSQVDEIEIRRMSPDKAAPGIVVTIDERRKAAKREAKEKKR